MSLHVHGRWPSRWACPTRARRRAALAVLAVIIPSVVAISATPCATMAQGAGHVDGSIVTREGPLGDAAVFLMPVGREVAAPPVQDRIDQVDLQFVPRAVVITPGSRIEFPNSDVVMHNVFHPGSGAQGFDLGTYPQSDSRTFTFADTGIFVMLCHVHPEMVGFVYVVASPYRVITADDGKFSIPDVPPGEYRLHVRHRRFQDPDLSLSVRVDGASTGQILVGPAERRRSRS